MNKEELRHNLSLLLMDTNITNPVNCNIVIGEDFVNNFMFYHKLYGVEIFDRLVEELNKL